jgi:hypothetical protein
MANQRKNCKTASTGNFGCSNRSRGGAAFTAAVIQAAPVYTPGRRGAFAPAIPVTTTEKRAGRGPTPRCVRARGGGGGLRQVAPVFKREKAGRV